MYHVWILLCEFIWKRFGIAKERERKIKTERKNEKIITKIMRIIREISVVAVLRIFRNTRYTHHFEIEISTCHTSLILPTQYQLSIWSSNCFSFSFIYLLYLCHVWWSILRTSYIGDTNSYMYIKLLIYYFFHFKNCSHVDIFWKIMPFTNASLA